MSTPRQFFMHDQARGKIKSIMGEDWLAGPAGALWTAVVLVSALSILGGMGSAKAHRVGLHPAAPQPVHSDVRVHRGHYLRRID